MFGPIRPDLAGPPEPQPEQAPGYSVFFPYLQNQIAFQESQMLPGEVLRGATNVLRRTPEQMVELTQQIQKEGVKPGAILMRRTPEGGLELVEGHHTATVAQALNPDSPVPVRILEAPKMPAG